MSKFYGKYISPDEEMILYAPSAELSRIGITLLFKNYKGYIFKKESDGLPLTKIIHDKNIKVKPIKIGRNVTFYTPTVIYEGTEIGDFSTVCANTVIRQNTIIGHHTVIGTATCIEGDCRIGNHVTLHSQNHITEGVVIESGVFAAPFFLTTNTPRIKHGRKFKLETKGPLIKFGARIGGRVVLNPGVIVGENTLIGSGSVVTKNIDDRKIAFGNPAKIRGIVPEDEILEKEENE